MRTPQNQISTFFLKRMRVKGQITFLDPHLSHMHKGHEKKPRKNVQDFCLSLYFATYRSYSTTWTVYENESKTWHLINPAN